MPRHLPIAALAAAAVLGSGAVARAQPERPPSEAERATERQSVSVEIWSAVGSADVMTEDGFGGGEFMFMTGVLGLVRFAPFEVGLTLDVGDREDDTHVLIGPAFGVGFDIVRNFRFEGLLQIGGHFVDGIGYRYAFEDGATGDESTWLLQGGLRLGLSGRIGGDLPRVIVGGWVAAIRDLNTTTTTITYPGGGGSEVWEVGGAMGLVAVRFGFEW